MYDKDIFNIMEKVKQNKAACGKTQTPCSCGEESDLQPLLTDSSGQISCCGFSPKPENTPFERPGFKVRHFVETFVETPAGWVPRVKTGMQFPDIFGTVKTRQIGRAHV